MGLPGIDVGIYTAVESSNRSQANGVQVHSCGNLLPHSVVINIFHQLFCLSLTLFFLRFYLFIFRERGKEEKREGEKRQCVVASCVPPAGDLACNPGMCPNWELKQQPCG